MHCWRAKGWMEVMHYQRAGGCDASLVHKGAGWK